MWENNINMGVQKVGFETINWIHVSLVNTVVILSHHSTFQYVAAA